MVPQKDGCSAESDLNSSLKPESPNADTEEDSRKQDQHARLGENSRHARAAQEQIEQSLH